MSTQALDTDGLRYRGNTELSGEPLVIQRHGSKSRDKDGLLEKFRQDQKTFGRTPGGNVFIVPKTHDMVSQLLSPTQPKNLGDFIVVVILALHVLSLYMLPSSWRTPVFAFIYLFWRASYNAGIGLLLHLQSNDGRLVMWARKWKLFENPQLGANPRPWLYSFLKRELEAKITKDYSLDEAPIEYNTWLVFRRFVDLILMCDFTSYCLFAVACGGRPATESVLMTVFRWLLGWGLVGFNLWVKLDAHRVVKDYAWYWGDFFYLIDQELTFDGVFEMAPHPMYSVGYAGYYGISLMAASYNVLFISLVAHAAQFAFLVWVENPHIEKTYNSPPPRKQPETNKDCETNGTSEEIQRTQVTTIQVSTAQPSPVHKMLGLSNIDLYRTTDSSVVLLQVHLLVLTLATPKSTLFKTGFVLNALIWRLWYSLGIGYFLNRQSNEKWWTRHFLKYGESRNEAWRQWKGLYHISMSMTYASFIAASWKLYEYPSDWSKDMALLKHTGGVALVCLHLWTSVSIYDSLGEFGWFYGDFFFDHASKLTYGGIYRFLNNPERVIGLAGLWAAVLFTGSLTIFLTALLSHVLSLAFIQCVERPHMQKLYGQGLRGDSGLVKSLKKSLPPSFRYWQGSVDKMFGETVDFVEDFIDAARPKIAAGVNLLVKDTTSIFRQPARISITRLEPDLAGYDPKDYSIKIEALFSDAETPYFTYGTPIRVKWTAPLNHSKRDWIGLYRVADNASREATRLSSAGRWIPTNPGQYESAVTNYGLLASDELISGSTRKDGESQDFLSGTVEFSGDKLWWITGVFEFRYHHNGKHNVMAISRPFEIRIDRFDEDNVEADPDRSVQASVEEILLPFVRNCFDNNLDIAPSSASENYGSLVERDGKYARRVVYAVTQLFGIEFAPEVVQSDGNVRNLAWRICNAKQVLAPYSMNQFKGRSTPTHTKFQKEQTGKRDNDQEYFL